MSRTIKIYNKLNLKKTQRYNLDYIIKKLKEGDITPITNTGIPYTKYASLCMGNCSSCKDQSNSTKNRRLTYKKDLILQLKEEKDLLKNCTPIEIMEDIFYEMENFNY